MVQPIGQMLRTDPAGGAVLHQTDIVDVWNLGTSNALINPTHHIAQDALRVVFHFAHDLFAAPFAVGCDWDFQNCVHVGAPPAGLEL